MKMARLIAAIEPARPASNETLLRVLLANLAKSLRRNAANRDGARKRLNEWLSELEPLVKAGTVHVDDMYAAAADVFNARIGDKHFLKTGRILTRHLDAPAVSIVTDDALSHWLGFEVIAPKPYEIQAHCSLLSSRKYVTGTCVGLTGGAAWLTPFIDRIRSLAEEAALMPSYDTNTETNSRYCTIAEEARNHLGLAHVPMGASLIALVKKSTIGQIVARATKDTERPVAPTVIEGRCHPRWRHWPDKASIHCYGRAFELNRTGPSVAGEGENGALECVRAPLPLDDIDRFVFLGPIVSSATETDEQFAADIAVNDSLKALLRRVGRLASR